MPKIKFEFEATSGNIIKAEFNRSRTSASFGWVDDNQDLAENDLAEFVAAIQVLFDGEVSLEDATLAFFSVYAQTGLLTEQGIAAAWKRLTSVEPETISAASPYAGLGEDDGEY